MCIACLFFNKQKKNSELQNVVFFTCATIIIIIVKVLLQELKTFMCFSEDHYGIAILSRLLSFVLSSPFHYATINGIYSVMRTCMCFACLQTKD